MRRTASSRRPRSSRQRAVFAGPLSQQCNAVNIPQQFALLGTIFGGTKQRCRIG
jgi:hypothetical protein